MINAKEAKAMAMEVQTQRAEARKAEIEKEVETKIAPIIAQRAKDGRNFAEIKRPWADASEIKTILENNGYVVKNSENVWNSWVIAW